MVIFLPSITYAVFKESIQHECPQPTRKLVQLHPFQQAKHSSIMEYLHKAHADSLPHRGRAHQIHIIKDRTRYRRMHLENHLSAEGWPPEWKAPSPASSHTNEPSCIVPHIERKAMRKCRYTKRVSKLCKESACVRWCESAPNASDMQVDMFWTVCQI